MHQDLLVVIVNFNSGGELSGCLASLEAGLGAVGWRAVVVDNASTDGSERAALGDPVRVALVRMPENVGFARAANHGAAMSTAPLVLFLNPDARLQPGTWAPLAAELEADPSTAVVAPAVLNPDGSYQGNARGDPGFLTGAFGRSTLLTKLLPGAPITRRNVVPPDAVPAGRRSVVVDWAAGSCLLVRRDAFERVGGFDERYFLYFEDADFCRRIRRAGGVVRFCPAAQATHVVGRSSRTVQLRAICWFHRAAWRYYVTYEAPSPLSWKRPAATLLLGLRCGLMLAAAPFRRRARPPSALPPSPRNRL